ncbi:MAG: tyrosine-type recombinase/integrase [Bacteroidales bacterium]|jgi:site-specific recombinase XerD
MNDLKNIENYLYRMGHSKQTIKSYLYAINNFLNVSPNAVNYKYKDVLNYMGEKVKNYKNSGTKNGILGAVKKYYDYLVDIGRRNDHPCRRLILSSRKNRDIIHQDLFTSEELEMLMNRDERYEKLRLKNQTLTSILIYQGLTVGEMINLKINNIDFDNGTIYIKGSRKFASRHLELVPKQFRIIEKYIRESRENLLKCETEKLLIGMRGHPITVEDINYVVETSKPLFPDRNLNPMTVRMSVIANWLNEKRIPLEQVQLMAGHKWISATARFRFTPIEEQRELINKFHPLK